MARARIGGRGPCNRAMRTCLATLYSVAGAPRQRTADGAAGSGFWASPREEFAPKPLPLNALSLERPVLRSPPPSKCAAVRILRLVLAGAALVAADARRRAFRGGDAAEREPLIAASV